MKKGYGFVVIQTQMRRMTEAETAGVMDLLGVDTFAQASEVGSGSVYRESKSNGFWFVELPDYIPGAIAIQQTDEVMLTRILTDAEVNQVTAFLGEKTFRAAIETGKLYSSPYNTKTGSGQWYPGNDDIPPAK